MMMPFRVAVLVLGFIATLVTHTAGADCTVETKTDDANYIGGLKTLRACIYEAMAAGGEWSIKFDVDDTTKDAIEIELMDQGALPDPTFTGWTATPHQAHDNRQQIGFRIYEDPNLAALKITIDGTTQPLAKLNAGRQSSTKRVLIKPFVINGAGEILIFAQLGLKGMPEINAGQLIFKGLRIESFASAKWDKSLNQKFGGFIHQTNTPQTTIIDCELESIPFTVVAGEIAHSDSGHYITIENTQASDVAFVFLPSYSGALSIKNSKILGPAMCVEGHALVTNCVYPTIGIQGVGVSPVKISDTVVSRGLIGVFSQSGVDISCGLAAVSADCGFHNHLWYGIHLAGSTNSILTDVITDGNTGYGVYLLGVRNTALKGVRASSNLYGVHASLSHYSMEGGEITGNQIALFDTDTVSTSTVHDVRFHGNSVAGIAITKQTAANHPLNVTSSWLYDNNFGIIIQGDRNSNFISECFIYNNAVSNIWIQSGDANVISSCYIGIEVNGGCADLSTLKVGLNSVFIDVDATNTVISNTQVSCGVGRDSAIKVSGSNTKIRGCVIGLGQDTQVGKVGRWKGGDQGHTPYVPLVSGFRHGIWLQGSENVVERDDEGDPTVVANMLHGAYIEGILNRVEGYFGVRHNATYPPETVELNMRRYAEGSHANDVGIFVGSAADRATVGTVTGPSTLCVLSSNEFAGLVIAGGARSTNVAGCLIGLAPDGETLFKASGNGFSDTAFGGIRVLEGAIGTTLGSSSLAATYVGGHKFANAIEIHTPTEVYNVVVGLTLSRKFPAGNEKHGIYVSIYGEGTIIGAKEPNRFPIVGGNAQDGIRIEADNVTIYAAMVGIVDHEGTVIGNGGTGIYASHRAFSILSDCTKKPFTIDGTDASGDIMKAWVVVGGNGWFCEQASSAGCGAGAVDADSCGAGIQINSQHAVVKGCQVGVVANENRTAWVPYNTDLCTFASTFYRSPNETETFWPLKYAAIRENGLYSDVKFVSFGSSYFTPYAAEFVRQYCPHNAEVGIRLSDRAYFGDVRDNAVGATGGRCILNANDDTCEGDGISINIDYSEQGLLSYLTECDACDDDAYTEIAQGNTYPQFCDNTTVEDNIIFGSQRYGIFVRADGVGFGDNSNKIDGTHRRGVRIWPDVTDPVPADAFKSVFSDSSFRSHHQNVGTAQAADLTVEDPTNSVGLDACVFCECETNTTLNTTVSIVDCSRKALLSDQVRSMPAGTTHVFMRAAEMEVFPWGVLKTVNTTLRVLDLGENPKLNTVPQCSSCESGTFADFGLMEVLILEGTSLATATNNLFTDIAPSLQALDITGLSSNPAAAVNFNMSGAQELLSALSWYDMFKCPPGYFAADQPPSSDITTTSLCMRCPTGTQQTKVGAFVTASFNPCQLCSLVAAGMIDHDYDPATACLIPSLEDSFQLNSSNPVCSVALSELQRYADGYSKLTRSESYKLPALLGDLLNQGCDDVATAFVNYFDTDVTSAAVDGSESIVFTVHTVDGSKFDDMFVTPVDGELLIIPATVGEFALLLQATDGAGVTTTLVTWAFEVVEPDVLALTPEFREALDSHTASDNFGSCVGVDNVCYTQQPLRWTLPPLNKTRSELFLHERESVGVAPGEDISFIVQQTFGPTNSNLDFVANDETGEIFAFADVRGEYGLRLFALNRYTDVAGKAFSQTALVTVFNFTIETKPELNVTSSQCGSGRQQQLQAALDAQFESPRRDINTSFDVDAFVTSNCTVNDIFNHVGTDASGAPQAVFRIRVTSASSRQRKSRQSRNMRRQASTPASLGSSDLINTDTGQIFAQLSNVGVFKVSVQVSTAGQTESIELVSVIVDVRPPDTDNDVNGPAGKGCANGAEVIDGTPQDDSFTCACVGDFIGDNCEGVSLAAVSQDNTQSYMVGGILGGLCLVLLLLVIIYRVQVYRLNQRAVDIGSIQEKLLHDLGLSTPLDIGPHEFGLTITFENLDLIRNLANTSSVRLEFESKVVLSLKKLRPSLQNVLNLARVNLSELGNEILVVIPRPQGLKQGFEEQTVAILRKQSSRSSWLVGGLAASDVSLAVPRRVPREVARTSLLRLEPLGVGNFATVDKYQVSEAERGTPTYFAAVKSVKPGADSNRDDLIKEAAIMALFDHRHIASLIGVCSAPRDMPALLMMEFCENGTLEDYLAECVSEDLDTAAQLTFSADICRGLEYLTNRRVVHRDIAARNVLLDSTLTCKVSDFGMSTVLPHGEQFIVLHEPIPVRWAAAEVLLEKKFSVMSDVFSFGVLMFEIFSYAKTPYTDIKDVNQVAKFVREGGHCARPVNCPSEIYNKLVMPCFEFKPEDRPTFVEIHDIAIDLGGIDEAHDAGMKADHLRNTASTMADTLTDEEKLKLLGPSVHHLNTGFGDGVLSAMKDNLGNIYHDYEKKVLVKSPSDATIRHMVEVYGKPAGEKVICPRDSEMGAAYVDTLKGDDNVGVATALLSYTWGYNVFDVIDTLVSWAEQDKYIRDKKRTYIWICSLCLNQHRILHTTVTPQELAIEFGTRVLSIGRILPMLEPWHSPSYVTRVWCLFELFTAIKNRRHIAIEIILPPNERKAFKDAVLKEGEKIIDDALRGVKSKNATASVPADEQAIKELVETYQGGYRSLDSTVIHYLHDWFVSMGATKVATRLVNRNVTSKVSKSDSAGSFYDSDKESRSNSRGSTAYELAKKSVADYIQIQGDDDSDEVEALVEIVEEPESYGFKEIDDLLDEMAIDATVGVQF